MEGSGFSLLVCLPKLERQERNCISLAKAFCACLSVCAVVKAWAEPDATSKLGHQCGDVFTKLGSSWDQPQLQRQIKEKGRKKDFISLQQSGGSWNRHV